MRRVVDKSIHDAKSSGIYWNIALVVLTVLAVFGLIGMAVDYPSVGRWIAVSA
jgi:hypothetical protein